MNKYGGKAINIQYSILVEILWHLKGLAQNASSGISHFHTKQLNLLKSTFYYLKSCWILFKKFAIKIKNVFTLCSPLFLNIISNIWITQVNFVFTEVLHKVHMDKFLLCLFMLLETDIIYYNAMSVIKLPFSS